MPTEELATVFVQPRVYDSLYHVWLVMVFDRLQMSIHRLIAGCWGTRSDLRYWPLRRPMMVHLPGWGTQPTLFVMPHVRCA